MEEERREHVAKMKKMEMEMEQVFEMKVKEKVQKLKDSEAEVISLISSLSVFLLNKFKLYLYILWEIIYKYNKIEEKKYFKNIFMYGLLSSILSGKTEYKIVYWQ